MYRYSILRLSKNHVNAAVQDTIRRPKPGGDPPPSRSRHAALLSDRSAKARLACPTRRGEARHALAEVFGSAVKNRDPDVSDAYLTKQKDKPLRSPLIVVVVACLSENPKVPQIEQMLSAGAAAHNVLLASNAMGFGSIWLTGDNAYDSSVCEALGLTSSEKIIGFIYLGTKKRTWPSPPKPRVEDKITSWNKSGRATTA